MINDALDIISKEMKLSAGNSFTTVIEPLKQLKDSNAASGIYLSLVNIKKENHIGQIEPYRKTATAIEVKEPPVYINLYIMVSSNFGNYDTALIHLGSALEFFQNRPYLDKYNIHPSHTWPSSLERLVFDWHNLEIDKLNQLWGINGGLYFPSFLYQVRMLKVLHNEAPVQGPEITEIKYQSIVS